MNGLLRTVSTVLAGGCLIAGVAACSSSGESGGVSGSVQAPNGQIASISRFNLFDQLRSLLAEASATAAIAGVSPVPDGTPIDLVKIDDAGNEVTIVSTTTTSGGTYAFQLESLGVEYSSNLIVRVIDLISGVQMRAFVTDQTVNLDPVSEAAFRIILGYIATHPGTLLSDFTPRELEQFVDGMDLLSTANGSSAGTNIEDTVDAIETLAMGDGALVACMMAAAAAGETPVGPGDIGNFFPLVQGTGWDYQGTSAGNITPPGAFYNTVTVSGTKVLGAVTALVINDTNPDNLGAPTETYLSKDSLAVTNWGNNNPVDSLTPQIIPFSELMFPLSVGSTFQQSNATGLDYGSDEDGDGINETLSLSSNVTVEAVEEVSIGLGTFPVSLRIVQRVTSRVALSTNNLVIPITGTHTQWLVPGVGPVKRVGVVDAGIGTQVWHQEIEEELTGYFPASVETTSGASVVKR